MNGNCMQQAICGIYWALCYIRPNKKKNMFSVLFFRKNRKEEALFIFYFLFQNGRSKWPIGTFSLTVGAIFFQDGRQQFKKKKKIRNRAILAVFFMFFFFQKKKISKKKFQYFFFFFKFQK